MSHPVCSSVQLPISQLFTARNDGNAIRRFRPLLLKQEVAGGRLDGNIGCVELFQQPTGAITEHGQLPHLLTAQEALCGGIHALGKLLHGSFRVAAGRVLKGINQGPLLLEDVQIQRRFFRVQPKGDIPGRRACQLVKDELRALIGKHHVCRDAVGTRDLGKGIQVVCHAVGQLASGCLHQPGHVRLSLKLLIDREGLDQHRARIGKAGVAAAIVDGRVNGILPAAVLAQNKAEYRVEEGVFGHAVLFAPVGKPAGRKAALHTEGAR